MSAVYVVVIVALIAALLPTSNAGCNFVNRVDYYNAPTPTGKCVKSQYSSEKYECEEGVAYRYQYAADADCTGSVYTSKQQVTSQPYDCDGGGSCYTVQVTGYTDCSAKTTIDLWAWWTLNECSDGVRARCTDDTATLIKYSNDDCTGSTVWEDSYTAGCSGGAWYDIDCGFESQAAYTIPMMCLLFVSVAVTLFYAN